MKKQGSVMNKSRLTLLIITIISIFANIQIVKAADIEKIKVQTTQLENIKNEVIAGQKKPEEYLAEKEKFDKLISEVNQEIQAISNDKAKIVSELNESSQELESSLQYQQINGGSGVGIKITDNQNDALQTKVAQEQIAGSSVESIDFAKQKLAEIEVKNELIKNTGKEVEIYTKKVFKQVEELQNASKLEKPENQYKNLEQECKANPEGSEICKQYTLYQTQIVSQPSDSLAGSITGNGISSIRSNNPQPKAVPQKAEAPSQDTASVSAQPTSTGTVNTDGSCRPESGSVQQEFGYTAFAASGAYGGGPHSGIDLSSGSGTPIYSAFDGVVVESGAKGAWGNNVLVKHNRNGEVFHTRYAHLSGITVSVGETVKSCQQVGMEGSTGFSTGSHLHFGVYVGGLQENNAVNPRNYVKI
jgi:murein DD-endopeptidase MepM/ murein hydrolase activator NlpD